MSKSRPAAYFCFSTLLLAALSIQALSQTPLTRDHVHFIVQAPSTLTAPLSGRLLIFLKAGTGDKEVNADELNPGSPGFGAREIQSLNAGVSVARPGSHWQPHPSTKAN